MVLKVVILCAVVFGLADHCFAKDWRGISPLHSTCEDVKRLLKVVDCGTSFDTDEGRVFISFSKKPCAEGWNVPPGTVLSIRVAPKSRPRLDQLGLDLGAYKKEVLPHSPDYTYYSNGEEGVTITVTSDDVVHSLEYYPSAKDNYLRYAQPSTPPSDETGDPHGTVKLDEYGALTINEERKRLKVFLSEIPRKVIRFSALSDLEIYVIGYGGRRTRSREAQSRAERVKGHLEQLAGAGNVKIVTIDGGYRELPAVELYIRLKGGSVPIPSPTICTSEVQLINAGSRRNSRVLK
jgi:hypothetical protein